jgi:hypothetical protein
MTHNIQQYFILCGNATPWLFPVDSAIECEVVNGALQYNDSE